MSKKYEMTIGGRLVPADDYREIRSPADTNVEFGQEGLEAYTTIKIINAA